MTTFHSVGTPPVAPIEPTERRLHGEVWRDLYGWMCDQSDPRLLEYLQAERRYYEEWMAPLRPLCASLTATAQTLTPRKPLVSPWRLGDYEYLTLAGDDASHPRECRRRHGTSDTEVVLDYAELARGHAFYQLGLYEPSPDGRWVAYSVDHVGDEVFELRVRDLRTGHDLPVVHEHTYYTSAWSADSSSFFYIVHDTTFRPYRVYRYLVEERRSVLVREEDDPRFFVEVRATRDRQWVVISAQSRDTTEDRVIPSARPTTEPHVVAERRSCVEYFTEHWGDQFVIVTNDGGADYRIVTMRPDGAGGDEWQELLPPDRSFRIRRVDPFADCLLLHGFREGVTWLRIVGRDGSVRDIGPDRPEGMVQFEGRPAPGALYEDRRTPADSDDIVLMTQSLIDPPRRYALSLRTGERTPPLSGEPLAGYDSSRYRTARLWATAGDGAKIPITIAHSADLRPDAAHACVLTCYGAYERPWGPLFSPFLPAILDRGVVYAIAHVRGGGELGRRWWLDGRLLTKPNSITDLLAARDHLVTTGWAAPDGVALRAKCAGGIIAGAAYTFTPERWAAVVAEVPAIDILNSMLDPSIPLTINEWDEFGDPRDLGVYQVMRRYVAYENLIDRPRPPLLVTVNFHDPRVLAHKPAKWVAALRNIDTHGNQIVLRAVTGDGGHHGPSGPSGRTDYDGEIHGFILDAVSHLLPR